MKRIKINTGWIPVVFILSLVIYGLYGAYKQSNIIDDYGSAIGKIIDLGYSKGRTVASGSYTFKVQGIEYEGNIPRSAVCEGNMYFNTSERRDYTIVYYMSDPRVNKILTSEEMYGKYKVDFTAADREALKPYFICK